MSDFDKIFGDKLNEEAQFPGQGKNWKALSGRLDAFGLGTAAATATLRYWQLAAVGLTLASGLLVWKIYTVQLENQALRDAVRALNAVQKPETPQTVPAPVSGPASPQPLPETAIHPRSIETTKPDKPAPAPLSFKTGRRRAAEILPVPEKETPSKPALSNVPAPLPGAAGTSPAAAAPLKTAALRSLPPRALPAPGSGLPRPASLLQTAPPPLIRPQRERNSRFRVGVQAVAAVPAPAEKGISWMRGAGVSAEFSPLRNVWLTAASDWLNFDIQRDKSISEPFFHGKPPIPKGHSAKLAEVSAHPRQQQISLGIRYALPLRLWLRPSVRIGHTWLLEKPGIFSFKFEEKDPWHPGPPPPPEFAASKASEQTLSKVWRIGAALEHETPAWVFRAGVDWVDASGASRPAFSSIAIHTGLQYKF